MADRSNRADVRNPVLTLPSVARLQALEVDQLEIMRDVLAELHADATARANECWRKHKAPMAAYWKAVAVYAGHLRRALAQRNIDREAA